MLFPRTHSWTRRQRALIIASIVLALASFGVLIYGYERYYRGPDEDVFYGTWSDPMLPDNSMSFWEFRSDHTFAILTLIEGKKEAEVEGRWYAGGPNVYLRFPTEYTGPTRPIVMHIVQISPDQFSVRLWGGVYTFRRAALDSPRASNQAMERTATRSAFAFPVVSAFPFQTTLALGGRLSSCSR